MSACPAATIRRTSWMGRASSCSNICMFPHQVACVRQPCCKVALSVLLIIYTKGVPPAGARCRWQLCADFARSYPTLHCSIFLRISIIWSSHFLNWGIYFINVVVCPGISALWWTGDLSRTYSWDRLRPPLQLWPLVGHGGRRWRTEPCFR